MNDSTRKTGREHSLKFQFTLFFLLFVIAVYAIVIITSFQQLVGITETIGARLGLPVVQKVTEIIDGDAFERLGKTLDPADPYYEKTRRELFEIKQSTECIYLYTMAPVTEDVFRYIIDGSALPGDSEHFSPLGTEENIASYKKAVWKTINTKTLTVSALDFNTEWGWLVSSYAPILNSSGKAVGVIGCDFRAVLIYQRLWSQLIRQLVISAVFTAAGFAAYLYMVNGVNKQNRRLRELKEAAEAASAALKEERDTIAAMKDGIKIGLFFMDSNFVIQDQYSRALETVLSVKKPAGKKFTDLLSGSIRQKEKANLIEYFVLLFKHSLADHSMNRNMLEDLNPLRELDYVSPETKEEKILRCSFTPVDRGAGRLFILATIQDYTAEKQMERKIAEEELNSRDGMRSLFEVIQAEPGAFNSFLASMDAAWERINAFLDDAKLSPAQILEGIGDTAEKLMAESGKLGLATFASKLRSFTGLAQETAGRETPSAEDLFEIRKAARKLMKERDRFAEILKKIRSFSAWGIRKQAG
ncbi:MAG: hypothetical protein LBG42_09205 [Treponema sp.]|jgi:hypothetical protein|nr:hypothetical protein [Treponema sp.]